jgi:hypothetical protein
LKKQKKKKEDCISVCTNGALAMRSRYKCFVAQVLNMSQSIQIYFLLFIPPIVANVLKEIVCVLNYIKANPLRPRILPLYGTAIDSDYKTLLCHTEVRWLSKG